ncbi:MAG: tRNA dihydrouridine synthase DusB, partial [Bacteroidota bacterium]
FETGTHLAAPTLEDRIAVTRKHLDFSIEWKGERKGIFEMRRHYTNYFRGIPHFKPYRTRLVESDNPTDIFSILDEIRDVFSDAEVFQNA